VEITLRRRPQGSTGSRRGPTQTSRGCDSVTDFLAYPKEKGGLGLLMPGFFHKELRRVWASLNVNTGARDPGTCPWRGRSAGETYFNRLLAHQLPGRAATHCLQMCGLRQTGARGEGEAWLVLDHDTSCPKTAQTRTARHDTIVRVYTSACRGSSTRSWRSRHTATSRPEPEAGHLAIDKCRTIDGASPAPPDGPLLQREAQEAQGRDPRSSAGRTAPSTRSRRHLGVPCGR
ncbi:Hypothetical protein GSB_152570, partial [Giardia duodenalis]